MDKFFAIFGKVVIVVIILGGVAFGGYYFGNKLQKTQSPIGMKVENVINEAKPTDKPTVEEPTISIKAGVAKSANLSFDQYTINASHKWAVKRENQTANDEKLILSKDGYQVSIFQAATGGALCLYPTDGEFEGPSSKFETFIELKTKDGRTLRRSGDKNGTSFTVCQKSQDGSYQQPTNYGHISIKIPAAWNQSVLTEIDTIISSLKKI